MRMPSSLRPAESSSRSGFTLLELLAVVAVIAVLLALLLPALMGAGSKARIVQTKTEIGGLAKAIADFKVKYGVEPPSNIVLYETGANWRTGSPASAAIISRIWPQFAFGNHDFNLNGTIDTGSITLKGAECLVFFLGGPTIYVDANSDGLFTSGETVTVVNGFSKNPADPFAPLPATGTSNREGPYYTFLPDRLVTGQTNGTTPFTFGYADPFPGTQAPYLYVSSNEGQGYDSGDFGTITGLTITSVYLNGATTSSPPWNPNGYQIISAGLDRKYGGGPNAPNPTPFAGPYQKGDLPTASGNATDRDFERDNITNFSDGVLVP